MRAAATIHVIDGSIGQDEPRRSNSIYHDVALPPRSMEAGARMEDRMGRTCVHGQSWEAIADVLCVDNANKTHICVPSFMAIVLYKVCLDKL